MFYRVQSVQPLPDYYLLVGFTNGKSKRYPVASLFDHWNCFQSLIAIPGLFEQVHVDAGGYGISWNDELDLSCNELWENGLPA